MPAMMTTLGLDGLSPDERMLLMEELWESLSAKEELIPVTDAQKADLDRRLAALRADPNAGSSWEQVKARLRGGS